MVKVTVEDAKPSAKKLHIEVPAELIKKKKDQIISGLKKSVKLKGFRKGKVPRSLIEQTYKKEIEEDLKRELMSEAYEYAISSNKITTVSDPVFISVDYKEGEYLKFEARVDVKPEIELKEYKGIEIKKKPVEVTQKEIDEAIEQIREAFATLEKKDKEAEKGDVVTLSIKTFVKETGYPIKEFTSDNLYAELGRGQLLEEIEKEIYGMKPGETKKIEASYDDNYPLRALKGKNIVFEVTLKEIKQKKLPELNDEFARRINKEFKTVDDLINDVKKHLLENKEKAEISRQKEEIISRLLEEYEFELPESIVNQETNQMIMEYVKNMYYMGADVSSDEFKPKVLREKFEPEAKRRVKATFILLEIARKENLQVSGEEIKDEIARQAQAQNRTFEELYQEYQQKGMIPVIEIDLLGQKALDFVHKHAKIVEEKEEDKGESQHEAEGEKEIESKKEGE